MSIQHKTFDIEQKADGWIIASTPGVDRDKDRVFPLGLNIENYQRNPVLMFGHRYDEPWSLIGRAAELVVDETGMRIRPELREPATTDDPMHIIRALWDQGLLRAASIGFRPTQAMDNSFGGKDITQAELIEISLVPIPANQAALRLAAKGLGLEPEETDAKTVVQEVQAEEVAEDATEEVKEASAHNSDDPDEDPHKAPVEDMTPEQELRLAAILADFIVSIRPYL